MSYAKYKRCECGHTKCTHYYSLATKTRPTGYWHCNGINCTCEEFNLKEKLKKAGNPHDQYHK